MLFNILLDKSQVYVQKKLHCDGALRFCYFLFLTAGSQTKK